jgi:acyl-[acyl-carrier-protein]-phospholipid O-acyltransferase/long-chain-fatty-acid--[acyl-carrier-protein] ligase
MATLFSGKTVVNLNYTTSMSALQAAVKQADIDTIVTSCRFLSKLAGKGLPMDQLLATVHVIYLEDLKQKISKLELVGHWSLVNGHIIACEWVANAVGAERLCRYYRGHFILQWQ